LIESITMEVNCKYCLPRFLACGPQLKALANNDPGKGLPEKF